MDPLVRCSGRVDGDLGVLEVFPEAVRWTCTSCAWEVPISSVRSATTSVVDGNTQLQVVAVDETTVASCSPADAEDARSLINALLRRTTR